MFEKVNQMLEYLIVQLSKNKSLYVKNKYLNIVINIFE